MQANQRQRALFLIVVWTGLWLHGPVVGQPVAGPEVMTQRPVVNGGTGYYPAQWQGSLSPRAPSAAPAPHANVADGLVGAQDSFAVLPVAVWQRAEVSRSAVERADLQGVEYSLAQTPAVTRLESDDAWRQRIQTEAGRADGVKRAFPQDAPQPAGAAPRVALRKQLLVEPPYVCYDRLPFEEKNSERYGWELGPVQPVVSAGYFYADLVAAPLYWLRDPLRTGECSAGQCLPGDPVPYRLYLPCPDLWRFVGDPSARH